MSFNQFKIYVVLSNFFWLYDLVKTFNPWWWLICLKFDDLCKLNLEFKEGVIVNIFFLLKRGISLKMNEKLLKYVVGRFWLKIDNKAA